MDNVVGTADNDTINAILDGTSNADGTFKAIDAINGGAGTDTLAVVDLKGGLDLPSLVNVSNVEILTLRSAGALSANASTVAFETVTASQSAAATVTANAASNVNVSGATDDITVNGVRMLSLPMQLLTKPFL